MSSFAKNLIYLMEKHSLSENQLAKEINISQPAIHKLISGATMDPRISTIIPIANHFKISVDQLLGITPLHQTSVVQYKDSPLKLPILPWEEINYHYQNIPNLNSLNWDEWFIVNSTLNEYCYASQINNSMFSSPFFDNAYIIVDPSAIQLNGNYVLTKEDGASSPTIKKCLIDGNNLWLISLTKGIKPILVKNNDWIILGVILETYFSFVN